VNEPEHVTLLFDVRSPWCYQTSRWLRRLADLGQVTLGFGVFSLEVVNLHADEDPAAYDAEFGPALRVALALREDHGQRAIGDFYAAFGTRMWETPAPDGEPLPDVPDLTRLALADIGIASGYADQVLASPASWSAVLAEHQRWARTLRVFGVPTLIFGDADDRDDTSDREAGAADDRDDTSDREAGAAGDRDDHSGGDRRGARDDPGDREAGGLDVVFGPVLQHLPSDDDGLALWRHLRGLARLGTLYELKRYKSLHSRAGLPNAVPRADLRVADMRAARALKGAGGPYPGASLEWAMSQVRAERADGREA
jgi:DSBA-like thioredoxin domain